jgi:MFS family permease
MTRPSLETNWPQVLLAMIAQNVATGLAFGSFGTIVLAIETEYGASRSASSLAMSLMLVSLSLTASVLGRLLEKRAIRSVMMTGAVLAAAAYLAASLVHGASQLLLIYLLLVGPATAMLGIVPSLTLAARWSSDRNRGLALGLVTMPVAVTIVPLAIAPLLEGEGIRAVYRVLAAVDLLLLPVLLLVRDRPLGESAPRPAASPRATPAKAEEDGSHILRSRIFWVLVAAEGLIVGAGTMKLAHFVPLLTEQGRSFDQANMLLAISGGAGLVGSFIFGSLADRLGGTKALFCNALVQACMWTIFLAPVTMTVLVLDAVIVGACGAGVQAAFGVALTSLFGREHFSRALGFASLLTLPFLFGLTPLASLIYEATGNYHLPMGMMVGGFLFAAVLLAALFRTESRHRAATAGASA